MPGPSIEVEAVMIGYVVEKAQKKPSVSASRGGKRRASFTGRRGGLS